jgi:hypothetical protein
MTHTLINYSVAEEKSDENVRFINNFLQQLEDLSIKGVDHSVYRMGRASFIHICRYNTTSLCDEAMGIPAFKSFLTNLERIVDQEPVCNEVEELGHYENSTINHFS